MPIWHSRAVVATRSQEDVLIHQTTFFAVTDKISISLLLSLPVNSQVNTWLALILICAPRNKGRVEVAIQLSKTAEVRTGQLTRANCVH